MDGEKRHFIRYRRAERIVPSHKTMSEVKVLKNSTNALFRSRCSVSFHLTTILPTDRGICCLSFSLAHMIFSFSAQSPAKVFTVQ